MYTMNTIYGLRPDDVWWAASDLGWVVGHSYIAYGPLLYGKEFTQLYGLCYILYRLRINKCHVRRQT